MNRSRVIDHSVHRPCEEGINIMVRISEVQRTQQGVQLISSSKQPGHWPWSITIKATSFASTLVIQVGRARGRFLRARTGWEQALIFPAGALGQQQGQGHDHHVHAHQHHHNPDGDQLDDNNESDDVEIEEDALIENINVPALLGAIRQGTLKLPFDPDRFRWVSIYSPLRQAEIASQEYRKSARFQEINVQATDVKEYTFYHFQIWFSNSVRIPRLLSSSLSRLQQSMIRLRQDSATADVCIRLIDPEDEYQGQGEQGGEGNIVEGGGQGHSAEMSSQGGSGSERGQRAGAHFPDRCFSEISLMRSNTKVVEHETNTSSSKGLKRPLIHGDDHAVGLNMTAAGRESYDNNGKKITRCLEGTAGVAHNQTNDTPSDTSKSPASSFSSNHKHLSSIPSSPFSRTGDFNVDPEVSEEEDVVYAHKCILEGDTFFNRLLTREFHEARPNEAGMHTIRLSREIFPTKQVINTILDFVYAEVISIDLLQPLKDHALNINEAQPCQRAIGGPNTAATAQLRTIALDRVKASVYRCLHGRSAIEIVKMTRCPSSALLQAHPTMDADRTDENNDTLLDRSHEQTSSAAIRSDTLPTATMETLMAIDYHTTSENVPLLVEDGAGSHRESHTDAEQVTGPTRCQEEVAALTQLWDDLYGAAHFMQNDHLRLIAFSQLQLDQQTTLARAMRRGCMFEEVEQAMHDYLIREQQPIFGDPKNNQLRPYFVVENPFQMSFLLNLTSSMAQSGVASK